MRQAAFLCQSGYRSGHGLADTSLFDWLDGGDVPGAMGTGTFTGAKSPSLGDGSSLLDRDWRLGRDDHLGRRHLVLVDDT